MSNHPIMFIFFRLLTAFVLSFVLSSNNKNSFAGLHASWKCQLCTDHVGGKIQITKFKIVKQHICLAMKVSPIFFWIYPTFRKSHSQDFPHLYEWNSTLWNIVFLTIVPQQDICLLNPLCLTKHFLRSSRSWDGTKPGRSLELTFLACHQLKSDQLTIYLRKNPITYFVS